MSRIKVDRITDKAGTGAPTLVNGMNVTGKSTMGDIVGAAVTFNSITGGSANFSSDVSIGGTLTYEDVKNVDSVGLITARDGIKVTSGNVDISTGSLAVGLNSPSLKLHIQDGALPSAPTPNSNCDVVLEGTTNTGIQFLSGTQTQLRFGDADSTAAGSIIYKHTDDNFRLNFSNSGYLSIYDGGGENLRFTPNNEIGIAGANYGTSGQVLTSGGPGAAVQWASAGAGSGGWETIGYGKTSNDQYGSGEWISNGWDTTKYSSIRITAQQLIVNYNGYHLYMQVYFTPDGGSESLKTDSEYYRHSSKYRLNGSNYSPSSQETTSYFAFGCHESRETWDIDMSLPVNPNPGINGLNCMSGWSCGYASAQTWLYDERMTYGWHSGGNITGVRIYTSAGNFGKSAQWHVTGCLI